MQLDIWRIRGRTFHFGQHGLGLEVSLPWLHSDSLLAAILARLAELSGPNAVEQVVAGLTGADASFALTSAFPRAGDVLFFPNPLGGGPAQGANVKELKKVALLSEQGFRRRLAGQSLGDILAASSKGVSLNAGSAWVADKDRSGLPGTLAAGGSAWSVDRQPRVTVDRLTAKATPFQAGRTTFAHDCGLWFGIAWHDRTHEALIQDALLDLGHTGLGGERGAGFGASEFDQSGQLELPDPTPTGLWSSLGRYWPQKDEVSALAGAGASYSIQPVGGWIGSLDYNGQRRKRVHMLAEGSVLGPVPRSFPGRLDDVRPTYEGVTNADKHPIWRGGPIVAVGLTGGAP